MVLAAVGVLLLYLRICLLHTMVILSNLMLHHLVHITILLLRCTAKGHDRGMLVVTSPMAWRNGAGPGCLKDSRGHGGGRGAWPKVCVKVVGGCGAEKEEGAGAHGGKDSGGATAVRCDGTPWGLRGRFTDCRLQEISAWRESVAA